VLERTAQLVDGKLEAAAEAGTPPSESGASLVRRAWQFFVRQSSSSLTRRIIFLNLASLVALVLGILYLSQFRAGLIDARRESLLVQGEIIAAAIAASSTTADPDNAPIDLERLLDLQAGETYKPQDEAQLDFPIDPERVAPVLRRLVSPTNTRARIYDRDGALLLDSRTIYDVILFDLPPPDEERPNYFQRRFLALRRWIAKGDLPSYRELTGNGRGYDEVGQALNDLKASMVRINERAEVIVSVAVPVKRSRAVRGALMLQTQGADIDEIVTEERLAIFKVFMVAAGVMVVLSFVLAGTIGGPMRRLAESAQVVRRRVRSRGEIADYTFRRDEIGHLSGAFRDMTSALYRRIDAIESFAADVSHELKNPLTSLRSAVETMPLARTPESRARLLGDILRGECERLPPFDPTEAEETIAVAVVGRPNAGKSSLVNRLLGEERHLVAPEAGTTRDAIDSHLRYRGQSLNFIDTAGLRRRAKVEDDLEFYSTLRTERAIERAQVCVLVVDATLGMHNQDLRIATEAWEHGCGLIVVVNKWDLVEEKDANTARRGQEELVAKAPFLRYVPFVYVSALTGQRVRKILDLILEVAKGRGERVPTAEVNRVLTALLDRNAPPQKPGEEVKLLYASQIAVAPPTFAIVSNRPDDVPDAYQRYLVHGFREAWPFPGSPLRLKFTARGSRR